MTGSRPATRLVPTIAAVRAILHRARCQGDRVGLVPTMGYLHAGHRSLIERSVVDNDLTVVTNFVNPLQFAPTEDLSVYPRDLDADLALCTDVGADVMFAPSVEEMYPAPVATTVSVSGVSAPLEGRSRPTHFAGVATVVTKLFAIVGPCSAYFGEKDFQQLMVVRTLVRDLSFPVVVVGCPTIREPDGLALSSRNVHLSPQHREAAVALSRALRAGATAVEAGVDDPAAVRAAMAEVLGAEPLVEPDYAEVVVPDTFEVPTRLVGEVRLLVAGRVGTTRLIDNMGVTVGRRHDDTEPDR